MTQSRLGLASLLAAALAVALQVWPHALAIQSDAYAPGSAWEPRVKAILDVSRVAARGGPYLCVPLGPSSSGFQPADLKVNDLGFSALGYVWGRAFGRPLTRRVLMVANLGILVAALAAVLLVATPLSRLLASGVLLVTPVPVPQYLSPDPLAAHASLAILGIVLAACVLRRRPPWSFAALGLALFAIHKVRSAYALYAGAAILAVAVFGALRARSREPLLRAAVLLLACLPLELLWRVPLQRRAADPRVTQQDTIGTHPIYIALLEGIGWTQNRWGIKASDPWVSTFLAERYGGEPVDVGTAESERRSRRAYFELLREDPLHLLAVYARRLPDAARQHVFAGTLGAVLLLIVSPLALVRAWQKPHPDDGLLLGAAAVTACVLFQTVVLDPRLLYAYPLRVTTGLWLAFAAACAISSRPGTPPRNP